DGVVEVDGDVAQAARTGGDEIDVQLAADDDVAPALGGADRQGAVLGGGARPGVLERAADPGRAHREVEFAAAGVEAGDGDGKLGRQRGDSFLASPGAGASFPA